MQDGLPDMVQALGQLYILFRFSTTKVTGPDSYDQTEACLESVRHFHLQDSVPSEKATESRGSDVKCTKFSNQSHDDCSSTPTPQKLHLLG